MTKKINKLSIFKWEPTSSKYLSATYKKQLPLQLGAITFYFQEAGYLHIKYVNQ